jgi:hypothetical protein
VKEGKFGTHTYRSRYQKRKKRTKQLKKKILSYTSAYCALGYICTGRKPSALPSPHTPNVPYISYNKVPGAVAPNLCAIRRKNKKKRREKIKYLCPKQTEEEREREREKRGAYEFFLYLRFYLLSVFFFPFGLSLLFYFSSSKHIFSLSPGWRLVRFLFFFFSLLSSL